MRILLYNIERGGAASKREAIGEAIVELSPDVAVILEAVGWRSRKRGEALAAPLGGKAFYCRARSGFDLAILTRLPTRRVQAHTDLDLFHGFLSIDVEVAHDSWVRIHAAHLSPTREHTREREIRKILGAIGPREDLPEAIMGDLNGIRIDDTVEEVPARQVKPGTGPVWRQDKIPPSAIDVLPEEGWIDVYREIHPSEKGYTFPAHEPVVRYDYVFSNPAFRARVQEISVLTTPPWTDLSDHLPLLIRLGDGEA